MSEYVAGVLWERGGEAFTDGRYHRAHSLTFDGGVSVLGSSSPSVVPVPFSDPSGVDPEEAFVAALAACHMLWFLSVAARRGCCVDRYEDAATGTLGKDAAGRQAITVVTLRPRVTFSGPRVPTRDEFRAMHHEAGDRCFIAASVRTEVRCEPEMPDGD